MPQRGRPNAFRAWLPASLSASSSFEAPSANQGGQLHLVGSFCTAVHVTNGFASTASTSSTDVIV